MRGWVFLLHHRRIAAWIMLGDRNMILKRINADMEGTLSVQSWSMSCFNGIELDSLKFTDEKQGIAFRSERVTSSSGLFKFLKRTKNFGTINIAEPELVRTVVPPVSVKTTLSLCSIMFASGSYQFPVVKAS